MRPQSLHVVHRFTLVLLHVHTAVDAGVDALVTYAPNKPQLF